VPVVDRVREGISGGNFGFSASEDGVLTYVTYDVPETQLTWVARSQREFEIVGPRGEYGSLSIAPDGKRVAAERVNQKTGDDEIWIIELSTGRSFPLTLSRVSGPVWSPDGTRVAFTRMDPSGHGDIFVRPSNASGSEEGLLVAKRQSGQWAVTDWSADGRFILLAIQGGATANNDLWTLPLDDRQPRPFLQSSFNKTDAKFSPDGRWVAYTSDESGTSQIYVQSFPERTFGSQVSVAGGSQPRWRRDGKELFFLAADRKLMAVQVRTVPAFEAGVPVTLFELPNEDSHYDVTADGQRFLITRGLRELPPSPINVRLNWMAGLRK
jgi:Tol biopolymer transport system component